MLLVETVRKSGFDTAISAAPAPWRKARAVHDAGKSVLDVALPNDSAADRHRLTRVDTLGTITERVRVSTATPARKQSVALAGPAVQQRPAAGAQIIRPVTSVF
nr:hypothetical protein [Streptomyces sp. rh34]